MPCILVCRYLEVANMSPDVVAQLYKLSSVNLCSNLVGQIALETMVNPPREGDPSFAT
jgi:alanine transaminase